MKDENIYYANNVKVTSGGMILLYSDRICYFSDDGVNINIMLTEKSEDRLMLHFVLKSDAKSKPRVDIKSNYDSLTITAINFNSPFGMGLKKPVVIAELDERPIYLLFNIYKSSDANPVMDLSLYVESNDGKEKAEN